jgi:lipoyl(octanoyl) transferase
VTSLSKELGRKIEIEEVTPILERHIFEALAKVAI